MSRSDLERRRVALAPTGGARLLPRWLDLPVLGEIDQTSGGLAHLVHTLRRVATLIPDCVRRLDLTLVEEGGLDLQVCPGIRA
jgi:hypothetical protein